MGERYHGPLRKIFSILRHDNPREGPEIILRYAVKGINDTMGENGIVPTTLVYGCSPSFPFLNSKLPKQRDRMRMLMVARREMATIIAERRISRALSSKLPPSTQYLIETGDRVRVYREGKKLWEGPYNVTKICQKEVFVEIEGREKHFNISQILADPAALGDKELARLLQGFTQFKTTGPPEIMMTEVLSPADSRGRSGDFDEAIANELRGLTERGVYEIVCKEEVPPGANILGGRFVLAIKEKGTEDEKYKAHFVVQGHTDTEKNILVHNTTTLKQSSVRMLVAIAAIFGFKLWSQDVSQAYLQSAEKLMREVYLKPNRRDAEKHFHLNEKQLLRLLKPLYGLADSGDYWHVTFANHIKNDLEMIPSTGDLSLFFQTIRGKLAGLTGAYVDDSIGTGDARFEEKSRLMERKFESKAREYENFKFAGIQIERTEDGYMMHQEKYAVSLTPLSLDCTFKQFRSRRHELAWLKHTRPDLCAAVNLLAQVTEAKFARQHVR